MPFQAQQTPFTQWLEQRLRDREGECSSTGHGAPRVALLLCLLEAVHHTEQAARLLRERGHGPLPRRRRLRLLVALPILLSGVWKIDREVLFCKYDM